MNRIAKTAAAVGVIACVAGGVLLTAGYLTGGMDYVKQRDYNSISDRGSRSDNQIILEKTPINRVDAVKADLKTLDLSIRTSDDDSWYIAYSVRETKEGENPLSYSVENGVLTLREEPHSSPYINIDLNGFGSDGESSAGDDTITVYAPRDTVLQTAEIVQETGDLSIDGVSCTKAECKLAYGDIELNDCVIGGGSMVLEDGDASLRKVTSETAGWTVKYGDLTAENSRFSDGSICLDDGSIQGKDVIWSGLSMTLAYGDFEEHGSTWDRIVLTMQDGDVESRQLTVQGENTVDSKYGDVSAKLTAESRKQTVLDLRTDFGDINTYRSPAEGQNSRLTVTCADGDIDIE